MLSNFFSWWFTRLAELMPRSWVDASHQRDGIIIDSDAGQNISICLRRKGKVTPLTLGAAARQAGRATLFVRPPAAAVLVKNHTVPAAPRRQLDHLLRHELARVTPFAAEDLFWRWDSQGRTSNRTRTDVVLTLVPRLAIASALATLADAGLRADFIEVETSGRTSLLSISDPSVRSGRITFVRLLVGAVSVLAVVALLLPPILQIYALHVTNSAIDKLQPVIAQVNELRRGMAAGDAGREILTKEMDRTGDLLETLATVTRILPDDTFLTDFSMRERQMTLSGRSGSAPHLITVLSADPAIHNTAFAAPVTRIEGATSDVFSIKAEIKK